jgi:hypothetical protein
MTFIHNAFTEEDIICAVNESLQLAGSKVRAVSMIKSKDNILLKTSRGAQLFILLGSFHPSSFFVRGIHRIRNKHSRFTYLFNGQGGKNLDALVFSGESGKVYYASAEKFTAYLKSNLPHAKPEMIEERLSWEAKNNPLISEALVA